MSLTCDEIVALACEAAHSPGKVTQARQLLNAILSSICHKWDIAAARGQYVFTFSSGAISPSPLPIAPPNSFGSGPYKLPVDYLRMSGSSGSTGAQRSFFWWLNGVPYPIVPCDLAEFDMQVQQAGLNSYVWLGATDMSSPIDDRVLLTTTGNVAAGIATINFLADTTRLTVGLGVAGPGIVPGSTVVAVNASAQTCDITPVPFGTVQTASLIFGVPPSLWLYPPPSSAQQAMIRYQRRMPSIVDFSRYPWFDSVEYLKERLTGELCQLNDDSRAAQLLGGPDVRGSPDAKLSGWLAAKDDDANRAKTVSLDRRVFGSSFAILKKTKKVGW